MQSLAAHIDSAWTAVLALAQQDAADFSGSASEGMPPASAQLLQVCIRIRMRMRMPVTCRDLHIRIHMSS